MSAETISSSDLLPWVRTLTTPGTRTLLGVTGPPGAGKSTISTSLATALSAPIVGMDGFHLAHDVIVSRGWLGVKGAPHTFDAHGFVALVRRLADQQPGETIYAPRYDRASRNPTGSSVPIEPEDDPVIVEGNYLLVDEPPWSNVSAFLSSCIYVDLADDIRIERLVERHIRFGKSPDHARRFVLESDEVNARLVAATRERADLIVVSE